MQSQENYSEVTNALIANLSKTVKDMENRRVVVNPILGDALKTSDVIILTDYPNGFRARVHKAMWFEYRKNTGTRLMDMTSDKQGGAYWNRTVNKSTYSTPIYFRVKNSEGKIGGISIDTMRVWAFDQENHITFDGLCGWNGEENGFYKVEYFREFRQKHEAALSADELARTDKLISISEKVNEARRQYLAEKAAQTV